MLSRIPVKLISLCFLVNAILVYGSSSRDRSTDQRVRDPRHASCTTCTRDCPGTLSSPWYGGHVYEQQANREYRRFVPETYGERNKHYYPIHDTSRVSPYPFDQYNRPSGSGGAVSTGITATTSGDRRLRENPFDQRESRKIDSNVAPRPSAASFSNRQPMSSKVLRANLPINDRIGGSPYPRGNFYDTINRQRELKIDGDYRDEFNSYRPEENVGASKNIYEEELSNPGKNFYVVYRADRNSEGSAEEDEDSDEFTPHRSFGEETSVMKKQNGIARYPARPFAEQRRDDPSREAYDASSIPRVPDVNYDPYNLPVDSNFLKLFRDMASHGAALNNQNPWHRETEESTKDGMGEELEDFSNALKTNGNTNDRIRSELPSDIRSVEGQDNTEVKKDKIERIDGFIVDNTDYVAKPEETVVEGLSDTSNKRNSSTKSREESFPGIDLDLIGDIVDRPAEATEASPANPSTETSPIIR